MSLKVRTEAPLLPGFNLDQNFFGLKPIDKPKLHDHIFDLIWLGEGRWSWDTIYNMPVYLRKFYTNKLNQIIEKKNEIASKSVSTSNKSKKHIEKGPF